MQRIRKIKHLCFFVLLALTMLVGAMLVGCNKEEPKPTASTEYTVTFAGVENATNPNTVTTYTAESGEITLLAPEKDGYPFEGWTYNGKKVTKIDSKWGQDITLVANWGAHDCHIEF